MKQILIAVLLIFGGCMVSCQKVKRPDSYNYQRGVEAIENDNPEEGLDYLNKDLAENPKNGYSFTLIAVLRLNNGEYGRALTAADMAIKYLPKKDIEFVITAYETRADVYLNLKDTAKALNDYTTAIKILPDDESLYEKRAQIYYEQGKFDLSDADYRKMIALKPGEIAGYMGIGRNANARQRWEDAVSQFDHVVKLASDYPLGYAFRAESYLGLKKWDKATDDMVSALKLDWDPKTFFHARVLKEPARTMLLTKMKIQSAKSPNQARWPCIIGAIYEYNKQYGKAIEYYTEANRRDAWPQVFIVISKCQMELGDYGQALSAVNQALDMDSTNLDDKMLKATILYEMGNVSSAISVCNNVLREDPDYASGYYWRGWFRDVSGALDDAIADLSTCIVLDPENSRAFASRGDIYFRQGKKALAASDYKKIIKLEDSPQKYQCIHYAYHGLGMDDKAIAVMDSIIARSESLANDYYDASCLYARMGNKQKALEFLKKSLESGYRHFAHMEVDFDMNLLRNTDEYKALIQKYKQKAQSENAAVAAALGGLATRQQSVSEIPFTKESGVCKVKCNINGLPLHFVFDTGASDVTFSMVEANFMMKNGYLSSSDVVGNQSYMDANGDVNIGTIINLKKVEFGGQILTNIRASVVRNQKAPLLLGQSVLGRLGKIEIDNSRNIMKITRNR